MNDKGIPPASPEGLDSPDAQRGSVPPITKDSFWEFWRSHDRRWSPATSDDDPAGLTNVCHAGAPEWVNRYAARCQDRVFDRLLATVPGGPGRRALDVGCGAGRWARKLRDVGYAVVAVDLQPGLLERNRRQMPDIRFVYSSIQDFRDEPFDLVTSVTVIQHNPPPEQQAIVRRIRSLVRDGGHALIMENTVDVLPHVFARDEKGWRALFEENGFRTIDSIRYDYRIAQRVGRTLATSVGARGGESAARPGVPGSPRRLKRTLVGIDQRLEAALVRLAVKGATHCGFLFRAV